MGLIVSRNDKFDNINFDDMNDEHVIPNDFKMRILKEFVLRYFNDVKRKGKKWFLTPEIAITFFLKNNNKKMNKKK